jgi:glycosyltransferase involved in cell wall biosynthesis
MAYFGTLSPAKRPGWVLGAWRRANERIGPTGLAIVGGKPALRPPPGLEGLYREFGHLEDAAVSHALSAVDLMVLPFEDGVSERRSSASTSLAHGVAVLTTRGESTGSTLRSARFLAMADASDPEGFREAAASLLADPARLHALGDSGREAYGRLWSWDVVADRLAPHLDA